MGPSAMKMQISQGNVVISKKGRDKGRVFVVLYMLDADFAYLSDGDTRKIDHLKKKKLMHLTNKPIVLPEIIEKYKNNTLKNSDIRKALASISEKEILKTVPTSMQTTHEEGI